MTVVEPEPDGLSLTITLAGHVIEQVEEPITVTLKPQVASTLFNWSVAVQLTWVVPTGKVEPVAGLQTIVALEQVPVVVGDG